MNQTLCYFFSLISAPAGICPILKPGTVPAAIIASDNFDGYAAASPLSGGNGGSGFSAGSVSDWDKLDLWLNPSLSDLDPPQASLTLAADTGLTTFSHVLVRAIGQIQPSGTRFLRAAHHSSLKFQLFSAPLSPFPVPPMTPPAKSKFLPEK